MKSFLVFLALIILAGGAAYGGYYYGHKNGLKQGKQSVESSPPPPPISSQLPAVTPVETLRNFLGNFFFDTNFINSGYQQSPSLTQNLIAKASDNQRRQISVAQTFFCANA